MSGPNPVWELPEFTMTAGETKQLFLPIYNSNKVLLDVSSMNGRLTISEYINRETRVIIPSCNKKYDGQLRATLFSATLHPADTIDLCGKYIYQLTVHDANGACSIMRGLVHIKPNSDREAIIKEG